MKRGVYRLLTLTLLTVMVSCTKPLSVKWVNYDETNCADKWDYNRNNEVQKEKITAYCKSKGIQIHELEIFNNGVSETCTACECKTGRRIRCKISKGDLKKIKAEGFFE
jgi:hypothetical protein